MEEKTKKRIEQLIEEEPEVCAELISTFVRYTLNGVIKGFSKNWILKYIEEAKSKDQNEQINRRKLQKNARSFKEI